MWRKKDTEKTVREKQFSKEENLEESTLKKKREPTDQVGKGVRRMPGHSKLKKDAPNCEKRRRAVRKRRHADIRMGKPGILKGMSSLG